MPTKEKTETQLLRLIGNTPLQVEITLLRTGTYESQSGRRLSAALLPHAGGREYFDGLIITGAPVEKLDFKDVLYWDELRRVMDWADGHAFSTLYICWAAQAGLYYHYGVDKHPLENKLFGVFDVALTDRRDKLLRGFDDVFTVPMSRHTQVDEDALTKCSELIVLARSDETGMALARSADGQRVFATGHSRYDRDTLAREYFRARTRACPFVSLSTIFPGTTPPRLRLRWHSHANLTVFQLAELFCLSGDPLPAWRFTPLSLSEEKGEPIMLISQLLAARKPQMSCEIFPPKRFAKVEEVRGVIDRLCEIKPAFISVTYGAAGNTPILPGRQANMWNRAACPLLSHLTCINSPISDVNRVLDELESAGLKNVLALRSDVPPGMEFPEATIFIMPRS